MRETRLSGSEGGGAHALPTPIVSRRTTIESGCEWITDDRDDVWFPALCWREPL